MAHFYFSLYILSVCLKVAYSTVNQQIFIFVDKTDWTKTEIKNTGSCTKGIREFRLFFVGVCFFGFFVFFSLISCLCSIDQNFQIMLCSFWFDMNNNFKIASLFYGFASHVWYFFLRFQFHSYFTRGFFLLVCHQHSLQFSSFLSPTYYYFFGLKKMKGYFSWKHEKADSSIFWIENDKHYIELAHQLIEKKNSIGTCGCSDPVNIKPS